MHDGREWLDQVQHRPQGGCELPRAEYERECLLERCGLCVCVVGDYLVAVAAGQRHQVAGGGKRDEDAGGIHTTPHHTLSPLI